MEPQFSEFSFGFALTYELVNAWSGMGATVAPSFPSLYQEGQAGGGFDVRWDVPGVPVILQFKISQWMKRRTAGEWSAFGGPYYRFWMHGRPHSTQHDLLLDLDDGSADVYYAAPTFHETDRLNRAFIAGTVRNRSIFFRPRDIGRFADDEGHCMAFRPNWAFGYRFSDPVRISAVAEGATTTEVLLNNIRRHRPIRPIPFFEKLVQTLRMETAAPTGIHASVDSGDDEHWALPARASRLVRTVLGAELIWVIDEERLDPSNRARLRERSA